MSKKVSSYSYKQNVETTNSKERAYDYYINEMDLTRNWPVYDDGSSEQQVRQINVLFSQAIGADSEPSTLDEDADKKMRE